MENRNFQVNTPDELIVAGRAITYNSPSKPMKLSNGKTFVEIIEPGAITFIPNCRALVEHDKKSFASWYYKIRHFEY